MVLDVAYAPMQGHFGLTVSALSGNRCWTPGPEIVNEGKMTDASFMACLRQRNKR